MTEVTRYECAWEWNCDGEYQEPYPSAYMDEYRHGGYVTHDDYESLKARWIIAERKLKALEAELARIKRKGVKLK